MKQLGGTDLINYTRNKGQTAFYFKIGMQIAIAYIAITYITFYCKELVVKEGPAPRLPWEVSKMSGKKILHTIKIMRRTHIKSCYGVVLQEFS